MTTDAQRHRRVISADPVDILAGVIEIGPSCSIEFLSSLRDSMRDFPSANWKDCLSRGQIRSKRWLVEELKKVLQLSSRIATDEAIPIHLGCVYLCAGWYALLAEMICHELGDYTTRIRSLDIDPEAVYIADRLMKHRGDNWKVKSAVMDVHNLEFRNDQLSLARYSGETVLRTDSPNTVVNTSCEHIRNFDQWWRKIPDGKLVVVQSNDYFDHCEHINCVASLSLFCEQTPMSRVWFSGAMELELYTRFMRIGIK